MKKLFILLLILISKQLFAQDTVHLRHAADTIHLKRSYNQILYTDRPLQVIFAELFGRSLDYSVNYDRRFFKRRNSLGLSVGISYYTDPNLFSMPIDINYLAGKNDNYLEVGGGVTYFGGSLTNGTFEDKFYESYLGYGKVDKIIAVLTMGYRYQQRNGFVLRVGLNGWLNNEPEKRFINPLPYFALGYGF